MLHILEVILVCLFALESGTLLITWWINSGSKKDESRAASKPEEKNNINSDWYLHREEISELAVS